MKIYTKYNYNCVTNEIYRMNLQLSKRLYNIQENEIKGRGYALVV